jgi:hypothetical protein
MRPNSNTATNEALTAGLLRLALASNADWDRRVREGRRLLSMPQEHSWRAALFGFLRHFLPARHAGGRRLRASSREQSLHAER